MGSSLAGKRILVVEDEYFIAVDLRRTLEQAGADVVGPVGTLAAGLSLADETIDAAVLDVNLEETLSYPIADRLRGRAIPYMFVTGYDGWSLPDGYRDAARIAKPYSPRSVLLMVEELTRAERRPG